MAVRKILKIGDPLLRKKSKPIPEQEIRSKEIKKLIRDMFETMEEADGLGLAAPQVGILKQIVVVSFSRNDRYPELKNPELEKGMSRQVLINPQVEPIDPQKGGVIGFWEGCLSVPGMRGYVERPAKIKLSWYDQEGILSEKTIEGTDAVIYQHECDHLEGKLYVDRLKDTRLFGFSEELDQREDTG